MNAVFDQIKEYIEAHRKDMLALWTEIVNTESGTYQVEGVKTVCRILQREMEAAGVKTKAVTVENAGDMLVGEWNPAGSTKAPLLFIGHMDTVFKEGAAKDNPFRIDEDGNAHGPGVLDMKGGLVIGIYAVKAMAAAGYTGRPVKFIFAPDEENLHMKSNAKMLFSNECKGGFACFNFETGYNDDRFVVGRNGGGPVMMDVHGVAAHSGNAPEKGRSAILEAAHKIAAIEALNDIPRSKLVNCGVISGGIGENTIPDFCHVGMAIRFKETAIKDELVKEITAIAEHNTVADTHAEVDFHSVVECMDTSEGVMQLFGHLQKTADDCGYGKIGSFRVGGLSDSGIATVLGIPTVCGMGVKGEWNHTPREYAQAESLYTRCYLAACAAYTLPDDCFDK